MAAKMQLKKGDIVELKPEAQNPVLAYLAGLADSGRRSQLVALRAAIAVSTDRSTEEVTNEEAYAWPWNKLTAAHVSAIRAELKMAHSGAYGQKALAAIKGVLKSCWRLGLMDRESFARATDVARIKADDGELKGRHLDDGEVGALMGICQADESAAGVRDGAILALAFLLGPRISEIAGLELGDYEPESTRWGDDSGSVIIRKGKGGKTRSLPISNGPRDALSDWLHVRGSDPGPLFCPILYGEIRAGDPISARSLRAMMERRRKKAGVKKFSPHDCRRTACSNLLDQGVDTLIVQKILGHSSPATTAKYDLRPERRKAEAVRRIHIPYKRRFTEEGEA